MSYTMDKIKADIEEAFAKKYGVCIDGGMPQTAIGLEALCHRVYNKGWADCRKRMLNKSWIPCSERLPVPNEYDETGEFFKAYLVQTKSNRMHTALWDGTYWTIWTRGIVIDKVIAWMPLPEAYKGEIE